MNDHKTLIRGNPLASAVLCALALALAVVPAVVAPAQVLAATDLSPASVQVATPASQLIAAKVAAPARRLPPILPLVPAVIIVPGPTAGQVPNAGQGTVGAEGANTGCGWCWQYYDIDTNFPRHMFPRGNDSCGWPQVMGEICARCGSGKGCHDYGDWGTCHILCGPAGGDLAQILDAAQRGFEALSATVVADALLAAPAGIQVEYVSDAGRIDFILECAPGATARTIPVPPGEMRAALDAELRIRRGPRLVAVPTPLP